MHAVGTRSGRLAVFCCFPAEKNMNTTERRDAQTKDTYRMFLAGTQNPLSILTYIRSDI